jgi:hypothetical protein
VARIPARTGTQHQSLLHFAGVASWSDEKVLAKVRDMVLPEIMQQFQIRRDPLSPYADRWSGSRRTSGANLWPIS